MTALFSRLAWTLLVGTLSLSARADVILSTFGPGDSYLTSTVRPIAGTANIITPGYRGVGTTFSPGDSYTLDSFEMALKHNNANNSYKFNLAPDVAGQPGTPLESWVISLPGVDSVVQISSIAHPLLDAGATYWLTIQPTAANQFGFWYVNDQGIDTGSVKSQLTSSSTAWTSVANSDLAYRVKGTLSTPEPGTLALLVIGLATGLLRRRR